MAREAQLQVKPRRKKAAKINLPTAISHPALPPSLPNLAADLAAAPREHDALWGSIGGDTIDRQVHAALARLTFGISPASLYEAYSDWAMHLALSPGKQAHLVQKVVRKLLRFANYAQSCALKGPGAPPCIEPLPHDKRFQADSWANWPFNLTQQSFLLTQQWWHNATTEVPGVSQHHEDMVSFAARQLLDIFSPANFIATNPEVLSATVREGGANLQRGAAQLVADWERMMAGKLPAGAEKFVPGETVAVTQGEVVYRNELIELIQYAPKTAKVFANPVLIVPAWIMKYYILDLSPENSLVRYLVEHGHSVFMISWKNPDGSDRDRSYDDYRRLGVMAALDHIAHVLPNRPINAAGYCLGGTLLATAAADMARDNDRRLNSMTLMAAQVDFSQAGELTLFIDDSQVHFLEDMMWEQGYLDTKQMAGAFQLLRSNDLIWSQVLRLYLLGQQPEMNDLMAWNADSTRMPYRMHSEYLRGMFLNNNLARGQHMVKGRPVNLADIRAPILAIGTERDHVAPWQSVHKITFHPATDVTFLLASGGHNAGIVSPPGKDGRHFRVATKEAGAHYQDPDTWLATTPEQEGSWWPEWQHWLAAHAGAKVSPPKMGSSLSPAPGRYVLQR
nr:alpha/beta fold hydrolase [uncultured Dongia sp.]